MSSAPERAGARTELAVSPAQTHEIGPLLGLQAIVASALVEVGVTDPTMRGGLGDAQRHGDLAHRLLTSPASSTARPRNSSGPLGLFPGDDIAAVEVSRE
ncbi:MAG: hypothetical protein Q8M65_10875 [Rhodoglobus sp.]|nr:hypothetical protein [Rhodoglobus sp.]